MSASALKPLADVVARVVEERCIGCTLCLQACPVDAIVGAAKLMHTVIAARCTGCELCVPPCPVDCIEISPIPARSPERYAQDTAAAERHHAARGVRLECLQTERAARDAAQRAERKKRDVIARAMARARERLEKARA